MLQSTFVEETVSAVGYLPQSERHSAAVAQDDWWHRLAASEHTISAHRLRRSVQLRRVQSVRWRYAKKKLDQEATVPWPRYVRCQVCLLECVKWFWYFVQRFDSLSSQRRVLELVKIRAVGFLKSGQVQQKFLALLAPELVVQRSSRKYWTFVLHGHGRPPTIMIAYAPCRLHSLALFGSKVLSPYEFASQFSGVFRWPNAKGKV